jgi:hypothetical protein
MSWLGDPAVLQLKVIFSVLKEVEGFLILIEEKKFKGSHRQYRKFRSDYHVLLSCTGKELDLLKKRHLSKHCKDLVKILKKTFTNEYLFNLTQKDGEIDRSQISKVRLLISEVLKAEKVINEAKDDIKFQDKQKEKALKLVVKRPSLNFQDKGCYHGTNIRKLPKIFGNGIMSNISQKKTFGTAEIGIETQQGHAFISVYDPYSFWRIDVYFSEKGKLDDFYDEKLSEKDFRDLFDHNKDLNLSKFGARNIKTLFEGTDTLPEKVGIVNKSHIGIIGEEYFSVYHSGNNAFFASFDVPGEFTLDRFGNSGEIFLVINDTAQLIPFHISTSIYELLFINKINPKKIVGGVIRDNKYVEESLETFKYLGLPLYNPDGKLIWPLDS